MMQIRTSTSSFTTIMVIEKSYRMAIDLHSICNFTIFRISWVSLIFQRKCIFVISSDFVEYRQFPRVWAPHVDTTGNTGWIIALLKEKVYFSSGIPLIEWLLSKAFFSKFILGCIPVRFFVGIMAFLITFVAYMLRANISINMLAMARMEADDPDVSERNIIINKYSRAIHWWGTSEKRRYSKHKI